MKAKKKKINRTQPVLGIDFGTTRTVVCAAMSGRYPVASFDIGGGYRDYLPGLAACHGPGSAALYFGWDARPGRGEGSAEPTGFLRSIKRIVGAMAAEDRVSELAGADVSALELTTRYLAWVRHMLLTRSNLELDPDAQLQAMVAVPANASTRQRYITLEAFQRAGFHVMGMVNEPTAAAVEYAYRHLSVTRRSPKRYVIVYDLGGGTFDTAAVSLEGRSFELLASAGIGRLGGDDIDSLLLDMVMEELGMPPGSVQERSLADQAAMLESCREAKETLTTHSRRLLVDLGPQLPGIEPVVIDTTALYRRAEPLVERTIEQVQAIFANLRAYGIDPDNSRELGAVYLVGGATAFPAVGRLLRQRYGRKIQLAPQPHAATAVGLALAADAGAGVRIREATTRHFGVWREADCGREKIFDSIFTKDTLPGAEQPLVVRRDYHPIHTVGHLRFMECSDLGGDGQPAGSMTPVREVLFPYDPSLAGHGELEPGQPEHLLGLARRQPDAVAREIIVETYTYGPDGTIAVEIENRTRGYQQRFVLGSRS